MDSAGYIYIFMYVCKTTAITIMMMMIKGTMNLGGSKGRHGRNLREEREVENDVIIF